MGIPRALASLDRATASVVIGKYDYRPSIKRRAKNAFARS